MNPDELAAALERIEAKLTVLRVDLMDRMDRLQDALGTIRDDIGVNMGALGYTRRTMDAAREESRSQVDTVAMLHRRVRVLEDRLNAIDGGP